MSVIAHIPPLSHLIPSPCSLLSQPQTLSLQTHADLQWLINTLVDTEVYSSCAAPLRALQRSRVAMNRVCYMQVVYIYIYIYTVIHRAELTNLHPVGMTPNMQFSQLHSLVP